MCYPSPLLLNYVWVCGIVSPRGKGTVGNRNSSHGFGTHVRVRVQTCHWQRGQTWVSQLAPESGRTHIVHARPLSTVHSPIHAAQAHTRHRARGCTPRGTVQGWCAGTLGIGA
jgi:hypothetical protein